MGLQLLRMILAGVFGRHLSLQVVLGHWGEMVLFYLDQLDQMPLLADISQNSISEYVPRIIRFTPSGIYSQRYCGGPSRWSASTESCRPWIIPTSLMLMDSGPS